MKKFNYLKKDCSEDVLRLLNDTYQFVLDHKHNYIGVEHIMWVFSQNCNREIFNLPEESFSFKELGNIILSQGEIRSFVTIENPNLTYELHNIISPENKTRNEPIEMSEFLIGCFSSDIGDKIMRNSMNHSLGIIASIDNISNNMHSIRDWYYGYKPVGQDNANVPLSKTKEDVCIKEIAPTLSKYGKNLLELALDGSIGEVHCREKEISKLAQTLLRKRKGNACLIGQPGVGKTAVVEGLAYLISKNKAPEGLNDKIIVQVNSNTLIGGSKFRGESEERMRRIIDEVENNDDIIVFFDEIHNIVSLGSDGNNGGVSAGEALKEPLARENFRCIGATTFAEYKMFLSKDKAFERRFQKVTVSEPSEEDTINILNKSIKSFETHHKVNISQDIIKDSVELTGKYVKNRYFPDKAFDLIDEACAKHSLESSEKELSLDTIKEVIGEWTGIPVELINQCGTTSVQKLQTALKESIFGQENALDTITRTLKRGTFGFKDESKPIASFIFCGPTGVGKTETAKTIASAMMPSKDSFLRLDMSEFMDKASVSRLLGASPGYIGYESGGVLTEFVKQTPFSVIVFDEIEKADKQVANILLQILDYGTITDNFGECVDFSNTIVIATSNIHKNDDSKTNEPLEVNDIAQNSTVDELKKYFSPELISRFEEVVIFNSLEGKKYNSIISKEIANVVTNLEALGYKCKVEPSVEKTLKSKINSLSLNARDIKKFINKEVVDVLIDCMSEMNSKNLYISTKGKKIITKEICEDKQIV